MTSLPSSNSDDKRSTTAETLCAHALAWAARGFKVIPLRVGKKLPAYEKWQDNASSDPATIRGWWADGLARNYGVVADGLLIVDIDAKSGKPGLETWASVGGKFDTLCVRTPSGGFHLYYASHETANSAGKLGAGIDTRGHRASFVVGPGSVIDGAAYTVHDDKPIIPAPEHILNRLALPRTRAENGAQPLVELDLPAAIEHARRYLAGAPEAVEGASGDQTTYDVACAVRDLGISEPMAVELMTEHWNDRCSPPWEIEALEAKVGNAYAYAQNRPGQKLLEIEPSLWFDVLPAANENGADAPADTFPLLTARDIINRPPPEWLISRHLPSVGHGYLYSEPGLGKSFLALDMALSIANGDPTWHGDAIKADPGSYVLYVAGEGSYGFTNRIRAWMAGRGVDELPERFLMIESSMSFMRAEDTGKLKRTIASVGKRVALVIVDTVSQVLPGADENLQKDMTLFSNECRALAKGFRCAVLAVHHAAKKEGGGGAMRGSGVLGANGDFVFRLSRKPKASTGSLFCEKMKDGPSQWDDAYRFDTVVLPDGESSLLPQRCAAPAGVEIELTPDGHTAILDAVQKAWDAGKPWSMSPNVKQERRAFARMAAMGFKADKAEEVLGVLLGAGILVNDTSSRKGRVSGLRVAQVGDKLSVGEGEENAEGDIFD